MRRMEEEMEKAKKVSDMILFVSTTYDSSACFVSLSVLLEGSIYLHAHQFSCSQVR